MKRHYSKTPALIGHLQIASRRWKYVSSDMLGPFPRSSKGNININNAVDLLSRWAEKSAIPDLTLETIAKFLEEQVFCRHSSPHILLSDNRPKYNRLILNLMV